MDLGQNIGMWKNQNYENKIAIPIHDNRTPEKIISIYEPETKIVFLGNVAEGSVAVEIKNNNSI